MYLNECMISGLN